MTPELLGLELLGQLGYGDGNHRGDVAGEMGDSLPSVLVHSSLSVVPLDAAPAPPSGVSAVAGPRTRDVGVVGSGRQQPAAGARVSDRVVDRRSVVDDPGG